MSGKLTKQFKEKIISEYDWFKENHKSSEYDWIKYLACDASGYIFGYNYKPVIDECRHVWMCDESIEDDNSAFICLNNENPLRFDSTNWKKAFINLDEYNTSLSQNDDIISELKEIRKQIDNLIEKLEDK